MILDRPRPDAVVTVVTYNSAADIETCVRSLATHFSSLADGCAEVHVVDNASDDSTPAILGCLSAEFPWLHLHLQDKNLGFGPGNNLVLNSVPAEAYILLNADAWLVADSFSPALARLKDLANIGIIGLPLVYPDGSPQSFSFMPSAWHRWLMMVLGMRKAAKRLVDVEPIRKLMQLTPFSRNFVDNHGKQTIDLDSSAALTSAATGIAREAFWVAGAAMVISPNLVLASGGFDPEIFLYGEDEDLCIQAHKLGFSVETLETAPIVHKLGWGRVGGFSPHVARMKYQSLEYFISKNVSGRVNRALMRALLPVYVYGRNIRHFFREAV